MVLCVPQTSHSNIQDYSVEDKVNSVSYVQIPVDGTCTLRISERKNVRYTCSHDRLMRRFVRSRIHTSIRTNTPKHAIAVTLATEQHIFVLRHRVDILI